jgi:hypothetical protein
MRRGLLLLEMVGDDKVEVLQRIIDARSRSRVIDRRLQRGGGILACQHAHLSGRFVHEQAMWAFWHADRPARVLSTQSEFIDWGETGRHREPIDSTFHELNHRSREPPRDPKHPETMVCCDDQSTETRQVRHVRRPASCARHPWRRRVRIFITRRSIGMARTPPVYTDFTGVLLVPSDIYRHDKRFLDQVRGHQSPDAKDWPDDGDYVYRR